MRKGSHHTPETKAKLSAANIGRPLPTEQRAKISESLLKGRDPSYSSVHRNRLPSARGKATEYECIDCGRAATTWAFNYAAPREFLRFSAEGFPYSLRLSDYDPRCKACHTRFDKRAVLPAW